MSMEITTNNQYRELLHSFQLTKKELEEFDYMDEDELEQATFIRYRGEVYTLSDFVLIVHKGKSHPNGFAHYDHNDSLKEWDGIRTDSFFSAIVIKYNEECDMIKIGLALS